MAWKHWRRYSYSSWGPHVAAQSVNVYKLRNEKLHSFKCIIEMKLFKIKQYSFHCYAQEIHTPWYNDVHYYSSHCGHGSTSSYCRPAEHQPLDMHASCQALVDDKEWHTRLRWSSAKVEATLVEREVSLAELIVLSYDRRLSQTSLLRLASSCQQQHRPPSVRRRTAAPSLHHEQLTLFSFDFIFQNT